MDSIRINKFLTTANICSRREADRLIAAGRVRIGTRKALLGDRVSEGDEVWVDQKQIQLLSQKVYLAFHKPVGVICTTDPHSKDNIVDFIHYPQRVYPVGRLDVRSSGLILLTNDGSIVNKILKGEQKVEKEYVVEVDKDIDHVFLENMKKAVLLDGFHTTPAKVRKISRRIFNIILVEGKNRQIRRMCEHLGYRVALLQRVRIGKLTITGIPEGHFREIPKGQMQYFFDL